MHQGWGGEAKKGMSESNERTSYSSSPSWPGAAADGGGSGAVDDAMVVVVPVVGWGGCGG